MYLQSVLNGDRKVFEGAHGVGPIRRVSSVRVALGQIWNDHLHATPGAQCPRFKHWPLVEDTATINVFPWMNYSKKYKLNETLYYKTENQIK